MATTTRAGLRYPALTDTPDVVRDIQDLAADSDAIFAMYKEDVFANRGAAGKHGRFFFATDTLHLYYDYGAGWLDVTPLLAIADGSVTTAKLADGAVTSAKIADGTITGADILDGTVTATELADAIVPSRGASGATEALRALGTAAGDAAPGQHAAQHLASGADPLVGIAGVEAGTAFPTSGLFNGYRFALDLIADGGGIIDCVYRADEDGTYPWHVIACAVPIEVVVATPGAAGTGAYAAFATPVQVTIPLAGVYDILTGADIDITRSSNSVGVVPVGGGLAANGINGVIAKTDTADNPSTNADSEIAVSVFKRAIAKTLTAGTLALQGAFTNGSGVGGYTVTNAYLGLVPRKLA